MRRPIIAALFFGLSIVASVPVAIAAEAADSAVPPAAQPVNADGTILITVILRHDQSKTLAEINDHLWRNGYFDKFPPKGVEVVSSYVVMGIGHIITVKLPPEKLRELNVALETSAWGAYRTEFYPTYDYKALSEQLRKSMQQKKR